MPSRTVVLVALLLAAYVGAYLWLSRRGYAQADEWNARGFYYFTPEPTRAWELRNYGCARLFAPLNAFDRALGTGRPPACAPLWGLSK
jgi:hypothetical protein